MISHVAAEKRWLKRFLKTTRGGGGRKIVLVAPTRDAALVARKRLRGMLKRNP